MSTFPLSIAFELSLAGQKDAIKKSSPAQAKQVMLVQCPVKHLDLCTIDSEGNAKLNLVAPSSAESLSFIGSSTPVSFNEFPSTDSILLAIDNYSTKVTGLVAEFEQKSTLDINNCLTLLSDFISDPATENVHFQSAKNQLKPGFAMFFIPYIAQMETSALQKYKAVESRLNSLNAYRKSSNESIAALASEAIGSLINALENSGRITRFAERHVVETQLAQEKAEQIRNRNELARKDRLAAMSTWAASNGSDTCKLMHEMGVNGWDELAKQEFASVTLSAAFESYPFSIDLELCRDDDVFEGRLKPTVTELKLLKHFTAIVSQQSEKDYGIREVLLRYKDGKGAVFVFSVESFCNSFFEYTLKDNFDSVLASFSAETEVPLVADISDL